MNDRQSRSADDQRESGLPGGGAGRRDEVGRSGLYPISGPHALRKAEIREQGSWRQGQHGAVGYEDHGTSELTYQEGQVSGGYEEFQSGQDISVKISVGLATLEADLNIPSKTNGVVLFAHGSGSSRHRPRNQYVADVMQDARFATLLLDLLTAEEESLDVQTAELRFNVQLLAKRLLYATEWLRRQSQLANLRFGYFGANTGAAAALIAAAQQPNPVAIVSRGGRPDLAGPAPARVQAPTLLIVGGEDHTVLGLNRKAAAQLQCEQRLEVVPGATHLFEEPGALDEVARLAREWFELHLGYEQNEIQVA